MEMRTAERRPNILEQLAAHSRKRAAEAERAIPLERMKEIAMEMANAGQCSSPTGSPAEQNAGRHRFLSALQKPGLSFICEVKRASPSKGLIAPDFPYTAIAEEYEAAGADAISCLTEPKWFLGSDGIFQEIRSAVHTPMLRKDFTVSAYQIYQAKAMGADAVLLICALLDTATLENYLGICRELGMDALVEAHTEPEIRSAVAAGAEILGVNNRNLKDFSVDFSNAARLRDRIPADCLYVAESGVRDAADVAALRQIGADAVLVGEALMRAKDKTGWLREMRRIANANDHANGNTNGNENANTNGNTGSSTSNRTNGGRGEGGGTGKGGKEDGQGEGDREGMGA